MDPVEIRKINYLEKGESLATGQILEHAVALRETTEKAFQALGEHNSWERQFENRSRHRFRNGQVMADDLFHDTSRSHVSIEMDGSVTIRAGVQDIGGGQASSLCHIVAEVLESLSRTSRSILRIQP